MIMNSEDKGELSIKGTNAIAEDDGFVYYYTAGLSAQPGVCLVAYGLIDESEDIIMQEK